MNTNSDLFLNKIIVTLIVQNICKIKYFLLNINYLFDFSANGINRTLNKSVMYLLNYCLLFKVLK